MGFAWAFHIWLKDDENFSDIARSILRTTTILLGEFNFSDLLWPKEKEKWDSFLHRFNDPHVYLRLHHVHCSYQHLHWISCWKLICLPETCTPERLVTSPSQVQNSFTDVKNLIQTHSKPPNIKPFLVFLGSNSIVSWSTVHDYQKEGSRLLACYELLVQQIRTWHVPYKRKADFAHSKNEKEGTTIPASAAISLTGWQSSLNNYLSRIVFLWR